MILPEVVIRLSTIPAQCDRELGEDKAEFAKEKETLTRRAEEAEAELGPVTRELNTALKNYVSRLCIAVFGKSICNEIE